MKLSNEYVVELGAVFEECPKAVLAAIAVSSLTSGGDCLDEARQRLANEWGVLYSQGIVPQPPGTHARKAISESMGIGDEKLSS